MNRGWVVVGLCLLLCGCDQLKGQKGDKGDTGATGIQGEPGTSNLLSSKVYTGAPIANPYIINCPEITDQSSQLVQIFMVTPGGYRIALPFSPPNVLHYYWIKGAEITLMTTAQSGDPLKALYDSTSGQSSYRIEIKTFATASAAQAYKNRYAPARSAYETLIYGRD